MPTAVPAGTHALWSSSYCKEAAGPAWPKELLRLPLTQFPELSEKITTDCHCNGLKGSFVPASAWPFLPLATSASLIGSQQLLTLTACSLDSPVMRSRGARAMLGLRCCLGVLENCVLWGKSEQESVHWERETDPKRGPLSGGVPPFQRVF